MKKCFKSRIIAIMLSFTMALSAFAHVPVSAQTTEEYPVYNGYTVYNEYPEYNGYENDFGNDRDYEYSENDQVNEYYEYVGNDEYSENDLDNDYAYYPAYGYDLIAPYAAGLFTYTVNMAGYPGSGAVWGLTDLNGNVPLNISFTPLAGAENWWTATFSHSSNRLSLSYTGGRDWRTPFNRSFVLTPEFNTVYIFLNEATSLVYPTFNNAGAVDFTVISWEDTIDIAGTFNNWTPAGAAIQPAGSILSTLTPMGAEANPARRVHTVRISANPGSHQFSMLRRGIWAGDLPQQWQGSGNATLNVPGASGGPQTLTINYFQFPQNQPPRPNDWNLWAWTLGLPPGSPGITPPFNFNPAPHIGAGWRTITLTLPEGTPRVGFIVRLGHWEQENPQIQVDLTDASGNPVSQTIYYVHGQNTYHTTRPYVGPGVQSALADWSNYIRMTMNFDPPGGFQMNQLQLRDVTGTNWDGGTPIQITRAERDSNGRGLGGTTIPVYHVNVAANALQPNRHYEIRYGGQQISTEVVMRHILDQFYYTGSLFHEHRPSGTDFRVWAPTATNVELALYGNFRNVQQGLDTAHFYGDGRVRRSFLENPVALHPMTRNNQGVWRTTVSGDLAGHFYMFRITHANGNVEYAVDPYATAVSANGQLSAVVSAAQRGAPLRDASGRNRLQREGLGSEIRRNQYGTASQVDHVIYEVHVRDFTIHQSWGGPDNLRGTYLGFVQPGTTVNGRPGNPSTGLDHLLELGITTVHLLPIQAIHTINELSPNRLVYNHDSAFNWGYDPQHYNVPEGSYSTDPTVPYLRTRELKTLIDTLHQNGIRVVKDVVYNHTYSILDGPFHRVVPGYYYRTWCNGLFSNGSGVGNEVASERPMVRRYIIDSVLYWQREFGIDGFRFDLMWLHDAETMYQVVEALRAVDPDVLIYGEPWRAAVSPLEPHHSGASIPGHLHDYANRRWQGTGRPMVGVHPTNHWAISRVTHLPGWTQNVGRFGFFNNISREIFMGHNDGPRAGFAAGGSTAQGSPTEVGLWDAIRGFTHNYGYSHWASDSINYVSKHDNLILWDNINWSLGSGHGGINASPNNPIPDPAWHNNLRVGDEFINNQAFYNDPFAHLNRNDIMSNRAVRSHLLAAGIVLTSQGVPFLHAGDEFLRTKRGHRNTYRALDRYNAFRWEQLIEFEDAFNFYSGLIELRNNTPAFRMDLLLGMDEFYNRLYMNNRMLAYRLQPNAAGQLPGGGDWRYIYVVYNGSPYERFINPNVRRSSVPLNIVVTSRYAGTETLGVLQPNDVIVLPPFSMFVAYYADTGANRFDLDLLDFDMDEGFAIAHEPYEYEVYDYE
ncbi:MAG: alpha-amylase family glycosyl hydrolase [Defluviitaleaceae bacterium]|nr:alpha-amylase family glycosyl hydrolase [Defluviitaleaceae bacterium]